jgi:hypothetical protein
MPRAVVPLSRTEAGRRRLHAVRAIVPCAAGAAAHLRCRGRAVHDAWSWSHARSRVVGCALTRQVVPAPSRPPRASAGRVLARAGGRAQGVTPVPAECLPAPDRGCARAGRRARRGRVLRGAASAPGLRRQSAAASAWPDRARDARVGLAHLAGMAAAKAALAGDGVASVTP